MQSIKKYVNSPEKKNISLNDLEEIKTQILNEEIKDIIELYKKCEEKKDLKEEEVKKYEK